MGTVPSVISVSSEEAGVFSSLSEATVAIASETAFAIASIAAFAISSASATASETASVSSITSVASITIVEPSFATVTSVIEATLVELFSALLGHGGAVDVKHLEFILDRAFFEDFSAILSILECCKTDTTRLIGLHVLGDLDSGDRSEFYHDVQKFIFGHVVRNSLNFDGQRINDLSLLFKHLSFLQLLELLLNTERFANHFTTSIKNLLVLVVTLEIVLSLLDFSFKDFDSYILNVLGVFGLHIDQEFILEVHFGLEIQLVVWMPDIFTLHCADHRIEFEALDCISNTVCSHIFPLKEVLGNSLLRLEGHDFDGLLIPVLVFVNDLGDLLFGLWNFGRVFFQIVGPLFKLSHFY